MKTNRYIIIPIIQKYNILLVFIYLDHHFHSAHSNYIAFLYCELVMQSKLCVTIHTDFISDKNIYIGLIWKEGGGTLRDRKPFMKN